MIDLPAIAAQANLAPSVHNTQPTLWRMDGDGIELSLNPQRLLSVGDPQGNDARLSLGAALEGTVIACAGQGNGVAAVELAPNNNGARVALGAPAPPDPDAALVDKRLTWRGGFAPVNDSAPLAAFCAKRSDVFWISGAKGIQDVSEMNDAASLVFLREPSFRLELLQWMRLRAGHPRFALDGLSYPSLGMSGLEAWGAGLVLGKPVFEALDAVRLGKALTSEAGKTLTSAGVVLFHRPHAEDRITSGRHLYRMLLGLTALGVAAWPMAALSDGPETNARLCKIAGLKEDRQLILCLRVGAIPAARPHPARARLPVQDLIVT